jgi:hypothetical protein
VIEKKKKKKRRKKVNKKVCLFGLFFFFVRKVAAINYQPDFEGQKVGGSSLQMLK